MYDEGDLTQCEYLTSVINGILLLLCTSFLLIFYRSQINSAMLGSEKSADLLVLPIYFPIFLSSLFISILLGSIYIICPEINHYVTRRVYFTSIHWAISHTVFEGVVFFLLQNSVSVSTLLYAFKKSFLLSLLQSLLALIIYIIIFYNNDESSIPAWNAFTLTHVSIAACLIIFYGIMWLAPLNKVTRRPAVLNYSRFFFVLNLSYLIGLFCVMHIKNTQQADEDSNCVGFAIIGVMDTLAPFVILRAFIEDSRFWQGRYSGPGGCDTLNLNAPLLGIWEMGRITIGMMVDTVCALEREVVPIIPFGNLALDISKFFSGGTARVYKGRYNHQLKSTQVAVKILFCIEKILKSPSPPLSVFKSS